MNRGFAETTATDKNGKSERAEEPGQKLRRARERLALRYRDVEEASQQIARRQGNHEFVVGLSRLADIENRGTVPSLYRLYSLCAIYRIEFNSAMRWYGVDLGQLHADAASIQIEHTHPVEFDGSCESAIEYPGTMDSSFDPRQTDFLSPYIKRWGKVPLTLLPALNLGRQRFGFIGSDDWSMYPILAPGSFVQIDQTKRKIVNDGWSNEFERPIYFLETRTGFRCCWCVDRDGLTILQTHSSSCVLPEIFKSREVDVIGQVIGVAKRLDLGKRRHIRSSTSPE